MSVVRRCVWVLAFACVGVACGSPMPFRDVVWVDAGPSMDSGPVAVGTQCGVNAQGEPIGGCSASEMCLQPLQGFPNGYCAPSCLHSACATGTECYPLSPGVRVCVQECLTDADCRTQDGYTCREPEPGFPPACLPNDQPLGRRLNGSSCFGDGSHDAGVGPYMAPLPSVAFTSPVIDVTRGRDGVPTLGEGNPFVAVDPTGVHGEVVSFEGYLNLMMATYFRGGLTQLDATGAPVGSSQSFHDHDFPSITVFDLAYDSQGRLHGLWQALDTGRPVDAIRQLLSTDGGQTVTVGTTNVFWLPDCGLRCDSPWLAVGPDIGDDRLYAVTLAQASDGTNTLLFNSASATVGTWEINGTPLAARENGTDTVRSPTVASISASASPGLIMVAWVAINTENTLAALGDTANRVRMRISADGGATWADAVDVSRALMDAPVAQPPLVGTAGSTLHVLYVTGGLLGVWDVMLATSTDGHTFTYRKVNDDDDCATHAFASMAVNPANGDAYVMFLDNRFGPGEVVYARCPSDSTQRCSRNELVSGGGSANFVFSTSTDPSASLGTHSSLQIAPDGSLWAAWTDSRTGGPGIYAAHGHP